MNHTKGKWIAFADTIQTDEGKIAEVCTMNELCKNNWQANAKLIAAAPDLLEACIELINQKDNGVKVNGKLTFTAGMVSAMLKIQETIKKATL